MYCCKKFNKKEGRNKYRQVLWLKRLSTASHMSKYVCYPTKILRVACHMNSKPWVQYKRRDLKTKNKQKKTTNQQDIPSSAPPNSLWGSYKHGMLPHPTDSTQEIHSGAPATCGPWGYTLYFTAGGFYECSGPCLLAHSCTQNNPVV